MYQNMQTGNGYYYNPYMQPSIQQPQYPQRPETSQTAYPLNQGSYLIKGRPVASFEEARAAQIDFDGSLFVFPDIGNKKIYTKQINLDGTATLKTYSLIENESQIAPEYVTKEEFNTALAQIQTILNNLKPIKEEKKTTTVNSF